MATGSAPMRLPLDVEGHGIVLASPLHVLQCDVVARSLTLKQRRFVREYVRTGNGTAAALVAYDTRDPRTASVIATETLGRPSVQAAVAELLDANGLSDRKLAEIHAHYLALYRSADPAEKALGLKALDMAYRLKGAYSLDTAAEDFAQAVIEAYAHRKAVLTATAMPQLSDSADGDAQDTWPGTR